MNRLQKQKRRCSVICAQPGTDQYFELIKRFKPIEIADDLARFSLEHADQTGGVKGAELLFAMQQDQALTTFVFRDEPARAVSAIGLIGHAAGKKTAPLLLPLLTDKKLSNELKTAAISALGRQKTGQESVLELVTQGKLDEELKFAAANLLLSSEHASIAEEAAKYLDLPATADSQPLPTIAELVRRAGNVTAGKTVFQTTGTCNKCHKVLGEGTSVGPDLSEIGSKLSREAMYISILDPSAAISHNFESYVMLTDEGVQIAGLLVSQTDQAITLRTSEGIDKTVEQDAIENFKKQTKSLMPQDLQRLMTAEQLVDLVEYLMTLRAAATPATGQLLLPGKLNPIQTALAATYVSTPYFIRAGVATSLGTNTYPRAKTANEPTLVKMTASSTQNGHPPIHAIDGNRDTRWCADGGGYPQWLQLEFEKPQTIVELKIDWEKRDAAYQYRVDGSVDGKSWVTLVDKTKNENEQQTSDSVAHPTPVKFVRVEGIGSKAGWCSIWEVKLKGDYLGPLVPADPRAKQGAFVPFEGEPFATQGNITPRIEKLTPAQEAEILKDVSVPDGFDVTVFAAPPAVNYPVFVAADVEGTLYVSSDGNGSLGRDPQRGRVIRLRDLDGDGRADETKVFCEVDAPRGLVWDHDRLYLMHPPHLSAFIDHDGDGVSDEQKILVKNLAFGYDKRPADHTTNGVSLGVDGWLYIAGGDFGFIDAEGTDGKKLTHRGGGVIRVRPDGTDLEIYSTGTRNILEVAISPTMDMFARDNTNDGGGWDVRLHHFTGMDDHGYPRLFKNFNDEAVQPLADYGGGSGCGAVYVDEPGFGGWNDAPFTADWGTGSLYRHSVSPSGATFQETTAPKSFIKLTRPTDADVDGNSRVYCASWRGATFKWEGPNVGYIVCVRPQGFQPAELPNFSTATDQSLVDLMGSPSYRRRMEAQRELMRRGNSDSNQLLKRGIASRNDLRNLVDHLQMDATDEECIVALGHDDPVVVHTAVRCLAKRNAHAACFQALDQETAPPRMILRSLAMMHEASVVEGLISRLNESSSSESSSELRNGILAALCRLYFKEGEWKGASWGTRPDMRGPYYEPEPWSETPKIAEILENSLDLATPADTAILIETMNRNRIQSDAALARMVELAKSNEALLGPAIAQLATSNAVPPDGVGLLVKAAKNRDTAPAVLSNAVVSLAKLNSEATPAAMLAALSTLDHAKNAGNDQNKARRAFTNSPFLDVHVSQFAEATENGNPSEAFWADAALLTVASQKNASPESIELARSSIDKAWNLADRRARLMQVAGKINNHYLDEKILAALRDSDEEVAKIAAAVVKQLKIKPPASVDSPRISTMSIEDAIGKVINLRGDIVLGEQVFNKANCGACHTVRQDEVQKGPYLGTIAKTYKRRELATAVLEPSQLIAQGFVTNSFVTIDGELLTGFVTAELSDRVTIRDQQGQEHTILKADIEARKTSTVSVMPSGVMNDYTTHELASLLDYLESLSSRPPKR